MSIALRAQGQLQSEEGARGLGFRVSGLGFRGAVWSLLGEGK